MWYAHQSGRRARQILADGAVLLWTALWAVAAVVAHRLITLATPHPRPAIPLLGPHMNGAL
ncbi:hypothetical protein G3I40_40040, partial [Streptomyces sp. SID14478]|nr:hypothetical protein [Streptomyces sp. SID14478]